MLGGLLAGCTSAGLMQAQQGAGGAAPGLTDRIASFFASGGSARPEREAGAPPLDEEIDCPAVSVRPGAATYAVHSGREQSALSLRYQGTISRTARECRISGQTVTMRVGIEGRVIVGPAGGPGRLDVPLRLALVEEGPSPRTLASVVHRVPVTIPPETGNVAFVQIDETLSFPVAPRRVVDSYVVYVGFDPDASRGPSRPPRRTARGS